MLRLCILQWLLLVVCVPQLGIAQNSGPKEKALALFEDYAPTIEEEEGPITYERPIQGDLNGDGSRDVLVEFGIGSEHGMATQYKQVAIYLNKAEGMQVVGGFEPEYCPSVDRIERGTVYVEQLEACALPHPETVAIHQYVFDSGSLKRRPASSSRGRDNRGALDEREAPHGN